MDDEVMQGDACDNDWCAPRDAPRRPESPSGIKREKQV
jgi:hypothetical protein